jgi:hypothetical protein
MENMMNKEMIITTVKIAIIFLLIGIFCGSGFVLCVADFVPLTALVIKIFGSMAAIGALISGFVGAGELMQLDVRLRVIELTNFVNSGYGGHHE